MWRYGHISTICSLETIKGLFIHSILRAKRITSLLLQYSAQAAARGNIYLEPIYRFLAKRIVFLTYSITASGFDTLPKTGPVLLISNHLSYVDGLVINALCERRVRFVIDDTIYRLPLIHYFMRLNRAIPISPRKEQVNKAINDIADGLREGDVICIFPEGRLTSNGFMSHFRPGIEWIIRQNPTPIYPIILDGLWGSIFSRKAKGSFARFFPRSFRRKVKAVCGDIIPPENVTVDQLHLVMLDLRRRLPKG